MNLQQYKAARPQPSWIMKQFWKAAGADETILMESSYSDHIKYFCLGGIVIATGFMAGLAGGYAFYTVFEPKGDALDSNIHLPTVCIAAVFGLIWGAIIYNLDRFIVTSTGGGDGTEAITREEFVGALPRIFMGIVIAITISKPLEIRIFKTEIDGQLHIEQQKIREEYAKNTRENFQTDFTRIKNELAKVEAGRSDLLDRLKNAEKEHTDQLQGRAGAGAGDGPLSKALLEVKNNLSKELEAFDVNHKQENQVLLADRDSTQNRMQVELNKNDELASSIDGLLERIKIGHHIAGFWITLFITLLFITIELTPIFFKLMLIKSPYDYITDNIKESIKAKQGIYIEHEYYANNSDENGEVINALNGSKLKGRQLDKVEHLHALQSIAEQKKLTDAQMELTEYVIQKWKEQEKNKIDANPESYIKRNGKI